ncbi:MAG TPA: DUF4406 domain-containing protein [Candidatus Kapabacteria bacterium]|nr:DUF4406 domain-containing protein [Candidatus Kapabacteria bacterium]
MATKTPTFKVYLAGKVTGEDFNAVKAKFAKKQKELEALGYKVINPVTAIDNLNLNWTRAMKRCIDMVPKCDAIYLMADWKKSTGAKIEYLVADKFGLLKLFEETNERANCK